MSLSAVNRDFENWKLCNLHPRLYRRVQLTLISLGASIIKHILVPSPIFIWQILGYLGYLQVI